MFRRTPLIVILGSTGTGKTKLSIDIAKKFNGEIISADSMQVYKGLDIVTAKANAAERQSAPHHLLDAALPGEAFTVVHFRDKALSIIDNLLSKDKIPILVGGTNYYIESILWKVLVEPQGSKLTTPPKFVNKLKRVGEEDQCPTTSKVLKESDKPSDEDTSKLCSDLKQSDNDLVLVSDEEKWDLLSGPELHKELIKVDPVTASRLHPNNKRKIIRSLQVLSRTGRPLSSILSEQRGAPGGCGLGGPLRYPHVVLFWLRCDQNVLDNRLDGRVDLMLNQGLCTELQNFHDLYVRPVDDPDYTTGILQTIGLKEFIPYLNYKKERSENEGKHEENDAKEIKLLTECLEHLKLVTRRYARKQNRWVSNRFLGNKDRQVPPLYLLDTTDPTKWEELVTNPALDVIDCYINEVKSKQEPLPVGQTPNSAPGLNPEITHHCEVCDRIFIGDFQYNLHMKSKKHQAMVKRKRLQQNDHV